MHHSRERRTYRALIRLACALEDVAREQRCDEIPDDVLAEMFQDVLSYRVGYFEDFGRNRGLLKAMRPMLARLGEVSARPEKDQKTIDAITDQIDKSRDRLKRLLRDP